MIMKCLEAQLLPKLTPPKTSARSSSQHYWRMLAFCYLGLIGNFSTKFQILPMLAKFIEPVDWRRRDTAHGCWMWFMIDIWNSGSAQRKSSSNHLHLIHSASLFTSSEISVKWECIQRSLESSVEILFSLIHSWFASYVIINCGVS